LGPEDRILIVGISSKDGLTHLVITDDAIWVPNRRRCGAKDAPGLVEMLLGSSLARRREDPFADRLVHTDLDSLRPSEVEHMLPRVARPIPFTSVISCWLTKGRWVVGPSFGFKFFDQRKKAVGSMSFNISPEDVPRLARRLSETIPDRFQTDWSEEKTY